MAEKLEKQNLLLISARTTQDFVGQKQKLHEFIGQQDSVSLINLSFSLATTRTHFPIRAGYFCRNVDELVQALEREDDPVDTSAGSPTLVMLFTGQGSQYPSMGCYLYEREPVFAQAIDRCSDILEGQLDISLKSLLLEQHPQLDQTAFTQPALVALEYAMASLWLSWGIQPDVVLGHSVGEITAACLSGILTLEEALLLACERGRLMQALPDGGGMMAVMAAENQVKDVISQVLGSQYEQTIAVAAVNTPGQTILSGTKSVLSRLAEELLQQGIDSLSLNVSHAFHSPLMEPMKEDFGKLLDRFHYRPPAIPVISNVTGTELGLTECDPAYWKTHVTSPVRFLDSVRYLLKKYHGKPLVFLECGPQPVLAGMVRQIAADEPQVTILSTQDRNDPDTFLKTLLELHLQGCRIDWKAVYANSGGKKMILPGYAFTQHPRSETPPQATPLLDQHSEFILTIDRHSNGALWDHRVFGKVTIPGAFYIAVLLEACRQWQIQGSTLEHVEFLRPLVVNEDTLTVRMVKTENGNESLSLSVFGEQEGKEILLARASAPLGLIEQAKEGSDTAAVIEKHIRDHPDAVSTDEVIAALSRGDVEWGAGWQKLESLHVGSHSALMTVNAGGWAVETAGTADNSEAHVMRVVQQAVMIDNVFPGILQLIDEGTDPVLPFSIGSVTVTPVWTRDREPSVVYGWMRKAQNQEASENGLTTNVDYLDEQGSALLRLRALQFLPVQKQQWSSCDGLLYRLSRQPLPPVEHVPMAADTRVVLIYDPQQSSLGAELSKDKSIFASLDTTRLDDGRSQDDLSALLSGDQRDGLTQYLFLYVFSAGLDCDVWQATLAQQLSLWVQFLTGLQQSCSGGVSQLVMVGIGNQTDADNLSLLFHRSLTPLLGTIALEHPDLHLRSVYFDRYEHEFLMCELSEFSHDRSAESYPVRYIEWECKQRTVRVLEPLVREQPRADQVLHGTTCVVVGGTGAIGLAVARWLIDQKVGHLVILARTLPEESVQASLVSQDSNIRVSFVTADISSRNDLDHALDAIRQETCSLIIHLAGVLDDATVLNTRDDQIHRVMSPKVSGGWNLHSWACQFQPEAQLLFFSSATGLFGGAGQAAYAVANGFLDALADYRAAKGMPGFAIDLGPVAGRGIGSALSEHDRNRIRDRGLRPIEVARVTECLEQLLNVAGPSLGRVAILDVEPALRQRLVHPASSLNQPQPDAQTRPVSSVSVSDKTALVEQRVREVMKLRPEMDLPATSPLKSLGLDSLMALEIRNLLAKDLNARLPSTLLFDYPTTADLAAYLETVSPESDESLPTKPPVAEDSTEQTKDSIDTSSTPETCVEQPVAAIPEVAIPEVAITGMACRLPGGVTTPEQLWELLQQAGCVATEVPPERWDVNRYYHPETGIPGRMSTRYGNFLDDVSSFDASFFALSEQEALKLDPQQRLLLETTWEACERAGLTEQDLNGSDTGVFVGEMGNEYGTLAASDYQELDGFAGTGNLGCTASGRISYQWNLTGPAITIDTACSSFLVALHLARLSLERGECSRAIVAAVGLTLTPAMYIEFSQLGALANDGCCKPYSADADGVGWSEGCVAIVLSVYEPSLPVILARLRGSAINQDGRSQGLTAPNGRAQVRVITEALQDAGCTPDDIDYLEGHGTGTPLGDPMEVHAVAEVFQSRQRPGKLLLGSVKGNVGHTQAAAGGTGLLKVLLAMQNRSIPGSLFCDRPSPEVPWSTIPVEPVTENSFWYSREGEPLRAGISAFGISGTNAHVIVESAGTASEATAQSQEIAKAWPFIISAKSREALQACLEALKDYVGRYFHPRSQVIHKQLRDLSWTLLRHRTHYKYYVAFEAKTLNELVFQLEQACTGALAIHSDNTPPYAWEDVFSDPGRMLALPTYPFQRRRYWAETAKVGQPQTYQQAQSLFYRKTVVSFPLVGISGPSGLWSVRAVDEMRHKSLIQSLSDALEKQGHQVTSETNHENNTHILLIVDDALQALSACQKILPELRNGRLWLAHAVPVEEENHGSHHSIQNGLLAGLALAASMEYPETVGSYLEWAIDDKSVPEVVASLLNHGSLEHRGLEDALRIEQGAAYTTRLESTALRQNEHRSFSAMQPLDVVLITGGTGELGRSIVQWFLDHEKAQLFILSRHPEDHEKSQAFLSRLSGDLSRITLVQGDCSQRDDLHSVINECRQRGTLSLVIHGAGYSDDALLDSQESDRWQRLVAVKYQSALWLDELTRDIDSLPMVLFSSAVSQLGNIGQASYIAANLALNQFAKARPHTLSLCWGAWENTTLARQLTPEAIAVSPPLSKNEALAAFGQVLGCFLAEPTSQVLMVAHLDTEALFKITAIKPRPLFNLLRAARLPSENAGYSAGSLLLQKLRASDPKDRLQTLLEWLQQQVAQMLEIEDATTIPCNQGLFTLGLDSLKAVALGKVIQTETGLTLPATLAVNTPHLIALAEELLLRLDQSGAMDVQAAPSGDIPSDDERREVGSERKEINKRHIAIIGAGLNLPGDVDSLDSLWTLLEAGKDTVSPVPTERFDINLFYNQNRQSPGKTYCRDASFIQSPYRFDPLFFGMSSHEATALDPQQRLLLVTVWKALEQAGIPPSSLQGSRTGVFIGIGPSEYEQVKSKDLSQLSAHDVAGTHNSFAAGRISHFLGLNGPSQAIDTACSSSLVAVHTAIQSLLSGECDLAIAGGVQLMFSPAGFVALSQSQALSPDGLCKAFSANADGYGRGEGCCIVVLKRQQDIGRDDKALALIIGSASGHDGASAGLTVPNGAAQQQVIERALDNAGIAAASVDYIEAHGTGTALGDPVEVEVLNRVFGGERSLNAPLWIGSVKGNVGHLESASGIAGLLKILACFQAKKIPAHLHGEPLTEKVPWQEWPVRPVSDVMAWPDKGTSARAGISAFGLSGSNVHLVLEDSPVNVEITPKPSSQHAINTENPFVFAFSAKTAAGLLRYCERYAAFLEQSPNLSLLDLSYSLLISRDHFQHRLVIMACSLAELQSELLKVKDKIQTQQPAPSFAPVRYAALSASQLALEGHHPDDGEDREHITAEQMAAFYLQGKGLNWRQLFQSQYQNAPQRIALPGYPFEEQDYRQSLSPAVDGLDWWLDKGAYPLSGMRQPAPDNCQDIRFIVPVSREQTEWLYHHRVYQKPVVAGAVHLCIAMDTAADYWKTTRLQVVHCNFIEPMVPRDQDVIYLQFLPDEQNKTEGETLQFMTWSHSQGRTIVHCRGRISRAPYAHDGCDISFDGMRKLEAQHPHAISPAEWVDRADRLFELQYDPLWRWVTSVHTGDKSVMLTMEPPDNKDIASPFAPVFFDNAFSIGASLMADGDINPEHIAAYTPFELAGLTTHGTLKWPVTAHYKVVDDRNMETVTGHIRMWNRDGECVFDIERYIIKRAPLKRLLRQLEQADNSQGLGANAQEAADYHTLHTLNWIPEPIPVAAAGQLASPVAVNKARKKSGWSIAPEEIDALHRVRQFNSAVEAIAVQDSLNALSTLGLLEEPVVDLECFSQQKKLKEKNRRLLRWLLINGETAGYWNRKDGDVDTWQRTDKAWVPANTDQKLEALTTSYPEFSPAIELYIRCSRKVADIILDQSDPVELLFPEGHLDDVNFLYRDMPVAKLANELAGRCIRDVFGDQETPHQNQQPLRILEVGAGSGATMLAVLEQLSGIAVDYQFTDIAPQFINRAKQNLAHLQLAGHHKVFFSLFDLEQEPSGQGLESDSFDIVIATNVIHATCDIGVALENLHILLRDKGHLLFIEGTSSSLWIDLIFGLLDGWWRFTDTSLRPNHPLLKREQWLRLLPLYGYQQWCCPELALSDDALSSDESGQSLFHCVCKKTQPATNWLLLGEPANAEGSEDFAALQRYLQQYNINLVSGQKNSTEGDVVATRADGLLWLVSDALTEKTSSQDQNTLLAEDSRSLFLLQKWLPQLKAGCHIVMVSRRVAYGVGLQTQPAHSQGDVSGYDRAYESAHAPLWGALRTLEYEYPACHFLKLDMSPDLTVEARLKALSEELANLGNTADKTRLISKEIHLSRPESEQQITQPLRLTSTIVPYQQDNAGPVTLPELSGDNGWFLITGGLGGLGLLFAEWLVDQGVRNLLLVSRSEPSPDVAEKLAEMMAKGATVETLQFDVSDYTAMEACLRDRTIYGVIHGAGVLNDKTFQNLTEEEYRDCLRPKLQGAWNLQQFLHDRDELKHFILFSAASSLTGALGQVAHCAANAGLDALCWHRWQQGLPALCLNWGRITELGSAAELSTATQQRMSEIGVSPLTPEMVLEYFATVWSEATTGACCQFMVMPASEAFFKSRIQIDKPRPEKIQKSDEFAYRLLPIEDSVEPMQHILATLEKKCLHLLNIFDLTSIDPSVPLQQTGIDSVLALEIRNWLNQQLSVSLPASLLYDYPTLNDLGRFVWTHIQAIQTKEQQGQASGRTIEDNNFDALVTLKSGEVKSGENSARALVLIPKGGSHAMDYRDLCAALNLPASDIPVVALEYPGKIESESVSSTEAIAARNLDILKRQGVRHLLIAGQSIGAVVAFEMARLAMADPELQVTGLVVIDMYAPVSQNSHYFQMQGAETVANRVLLFINMLNRVVKLKDHSRSLPENLDDMSTEDAINFGISWLRASHDDFKHLDDDLLADFIMNTTRISRVNQHERSISFDCPVALIRAAERPMAEAQDIDNDLGWNSLVGDVLVIKDNPGDHLTVAKAGNARGVAEVIEELAAKAGW
ncbi:type I polyketide synthase [Parendozoicomonas haliclonae]|uniref:Polyketide synthase PksM n=1 Tax=Parendozoicomonas haliclonae TaxID=1960125 RepID=A0A1X7AI97_9GAMM|nr:type I polyketide synthase [Parendozoicomonas haliclonae]SMA38285.1 Polyketide synthase PksM [Parendozoicomonas haliclonae]